MKAGYDYKAHKILRLIAIFVLFCAGFTILQHCYKLLNLYFTFKSPLLPKHLVKYASFPSFVIVPLFIIIFFVCIQILRTRGYNLKVVYPLFALIILYVLFQREIYDIIMRFNPYG